MIFCFFTTITQNTSVYERKWWLGILTGMSLLMLHIIYLLFGQLAKIILFPPSNTVGVISVLL